MVGYSAVQIAAPVLARADPCQVPPQVTSVQAFAGNGSADVSFDEQTSTNGSITYTATADPEGLTTRGTSSPLHATDLANGQAYTFVVYASNACGRGPDSQPSNSVTPSTPSGNPGGPVVRRTPPTIGVGQTGIWSFSGTSGEFSVLAKTRPSSAFAVVRRGDFTATGLADFSVRPRANTEFFARSTSGDSPHVMQYVRSALSLSASRQGGQVLLSGQVVPGRPGVTVRVCRVTKGRAELLTSARTDSYGRWELMRATPGGETYIAQSLTDGQNIAGQSNRATA
jgi:hypothetical protein